MLRSSKLLALALVIAMFGSISVAQAQDELNALVWCDHTDPELLEPFEEEFGVRVNVRDYEGTGVGLSILDQSRPGDWDVFVVDSVDIPRVVEQGILAPLNPDDFPLDDVFEPVLLPELHVIDEVMYAVPQKFGYNTIAFNNEVVDLEDVSSIDILFSDEYNIAIYDYYIPIINMVAVSMGMDPADITSEDLPAIQEALFEMKDNAALVGDVVQVQTALATGEVDIITGGGEYSTAVLNAENPALDWILPEEGGIRWQQAIGVLADSEQPELATAFVQYILSPEGQAALATSSCYWGMPANSQAALSDEQKEILRWDSQPEFIDNSFPYFIPDAELDAEMLDVWTEFLQR
ncbi:MAG: PotD/PotF family extracellular solute-binding protein [Chloroflexota bacterium]